MEPIQAGFLFLDGEYVPPPYELTFADEALMIKGHRLTALPPPREFSGRGGPPRSESSWRGAVGMLSDRLLNDMIVMSFANQPLFMLDKSTTHELLKSWTSPDEREQRQLTVRERLPGGFDREVWDHWVGSFEPPVGLKDRAGPLIYNFEHDEQEELAKIRARRWLESLTYPLTVGGMVLSVLAIGHLLGGRPHAGHATWGMDPSPEMIRALNWSLFFATAFSFVDLVWTIVGTNSNVVQELNPLGSQLIHDPRHLAGFKIAITFSCLALLWLLRRHKRAQIAAWWICLILTLVTCRWLMLSCFLDTTV